MGKIDWKHIKLVATFTEKGVAAEVTKEPTSKWKKTMLLSEHSPIRTETITLGVECPYFVHTQLVRHKVGVDFFVASARPDINKEAVPRDRQKKADPCRMLVHANLQAWLNISRKRLCQKAEKATREVWGALVDSIRKAEPELAECCVPECVYRGFCPESSKRSCGYHKSKEFKQALDNYRKV